VGAEVLHRQQPRRQDCLRREAGVRLGLGDRAGQRVFAFADRRRVELQRCAFCPGEQTRDSAPAYIHAYRRRCRRDEYPRRHGHEVRHLCRREDVCHEETHEGRRKGPATAEHPFVPVQQGGSGGGLRVLSEPAGV